MILRSHRNISHQKGHLLLLVCVSNWDKSFTQRKTFPTNDSTPFPRMTVLSILFVEEAFVPSVFWAGDHS